MRRTGQLVILVLAFALGAGASFAQDGKLKIKVTPHQAYVFVDGKPAEHEGGRTISLGAGKHTIVAVNYGYKIWSQDVNIESGKTTDVDAKLEAYGGAVNGPWGRVYLGGEPHAAVLANGTTPGYYVGHVDEFNNDFWIWKQELILPVGHHHLTVLKGGKTVWEGDVDVQANKKVSVDMSKNTQKTTDWPRGTKLKDLPRFHAGIASATIAVSPVKIGSFTATPTNINCSENSNLAWQTSDTVDSSIDNSVGNAEANGSKGVSPRATTTYTLTAAGPGGKATSTATVNVNTTVQASINGTPAELHYRKIGDKVITDDTGTVNWTTSNADNVQLNGNKVDASGNQSVKADPNDTSTVPEGGSPRTVDEQKTFNLNATNVCGGSATPSASFHVVGSVEPIPTVVLQSIFYPTDYPDKRHPQVGLVRSQQLSLATLADGFKKYLEYDPDAKLSIEAHADERGGREYNQDLSERRVERIKQYLVGQGIASDKVQTAAFGKERPLPKGDVKSLESSNPNTPPKARLKNTQTDWLAYNRRADIVLLPSGKKSATYFPHAADDSGLIWQLPKAPLAKVEKAD